MTILDRARGSHRIRIDPGQLADDLAKRLPDLDQVDLGKARDAAETAISDAADLIRQSIEDAGDRARSLRSDAEKAAEKAADDLGKNVRSLTSRVEQELPDTDRDRYLRAFERGRIQARTRYIVIGAVAGVAAAVLGVVFADKQRRDAAARRLSSMSKDVSKQVQRKVKDAQDRARGITIDMGVVKPTTDPVGVMDPEISGPPPWPAAEGLSDRPLEEGAHEVLPEELVGAGDRTGSPA